MNTCHICGVVVSEVAVMPTGARRNVLPHEIAAGQMLEAEALRDSRRDGSLS